MIAATSTGATATLAALSTKALWYFTRGAGVVTLLLLTASVVLGVVTSLDLEWRRVPRFVVVAVHRNISLLALAMLALHIVTVVVDGYAPIRWIDAIVPFVSSYHPLALGLGALALDMLLAITITSAFRSRLTFRSWRLVHWLAYACWPVAFLHGILIGTDRWQGWMLALDLACGALVTVATAVRLVRRPTASPAGIAQPLAHPRTLTGARR